MSNQASIIENSVATPMEDKVNIRNFTEDKKKKGGSVAHRQVHFFWSIFHV